MLFTKFESSKITYGSKIYRKRQTALLSGAITGYTMYMSIGLYDLQVSSKNSKIPTFRPNNYLSLESIKSKQNMNKRKIYTETPGKVQGE